MQSKTMDIFYVLKKRSFNEAQSSIRPYKSNGFSLEYGHQNDKSIHCMSVVDANQKTKADIVLKYLICGLGGQCAFTLSA